MFRLRFPRLHTIVPIVFNREECLSVVFVSQAWVQSTSVAEVWTQFFQLLLLH